MTYEICKPISNSNIRFEFKQKKEIKRKETEKEKEKKKSLAGLLSTDLGPPASERKGARSDCPPGRAEERNGGPKCGFRGPVKYPPLFFFFLCFYFSYFVLF